MKIQFCADLPVEPTPEEQQCADKKDSKHAATGVVNSQSARAEPAEEADKENDITVRFKHENEGSVRPNIRYPQGLRHFQAPVLRIWSAELSWPHCGHCL